MLDVAIWQQPQSMTVHLVNLTNPMMMKGPVREIIPVPAQQVRVDIPNGRRIKAVNLLVAKKQGQYRHENGTIELETPSIGLHEVIAIDFES